MLSNHKKHITIYCTWIVITVSQFCVPLKRQIILQDKSKKTVLQLHKTDTVLYMLPFDYKLKPKDIVSVSLLSLIKGEYDLSTLGQQGNAAMGGNQQQGGGNSNTGYIIDNNGEIKLPILGKIKIKGLNIEDAGFEIQKVVDKYLDNVSVNVTMLNYYVVMMGEIMIQGRVNAEGNKLTLFDAIAFSGGFNEFANRNNIKIVRRDSLKTHIFYVDATNEDLLTTSKVYLMPNDIVIVEPMRAKNLRTYSLTNISLLVSTVTLSLTLIFSFRNLFR